MKGLLIVFEGIDGAGKSTQVKMLADVLLRRGYPVEICREPGGTKTGELIRKVLLDSSQHIVPPAEAFLYAASRAQLLADVLRPALKQGKVIISDRFSDSTLAYQGFGRGLPVDLLRQVDQLATGGLRPDLTILLDLPPELIRNRLAGRTDRLEKEAVSFFQRVRQGYLTLANERPKGYFVLDACCPVEEIHRQALGKVESFL